MEDEREEKEMFADYHVHTEFSDDSVYPIEEVVKDAIKMEMDEICFTDHVDYGVKVDWDSGEEIQIHYRDGEPFANVDYPNYVMQIRNLQNLYGDKITIKMGMEFGIQMHTIPKFESLFARYPFDFVILSVHQVEDKEFWTQDFQRGRTQKEYNERYYEEMLNLVNHYQNYSVLGHMDLIVRYDELGIYPFEKVKPYIEKILKKVKFVDDNYFALLKYQIISCPDLSIFQTVDEGIENRIKKEIKNAENWEDLVQRLKTKRYTYNRIQRMLCHILCNFTKKEAETFSARKRKP